MQVMLRSFTGKYVSPTYGGEWGISKTTLQYSLLALLPPKKTIIDGNPFLQWITPVPVEWLVERDWWIQTHWEDNDCRNVYRRLVSCPKLSDMISTARLYPVLQVTEPPKEATMHTSTVMLHRFLLTARELEIIYSLVSADYLVSMHTTGSFATTGVIKSKLSIQILKWTVKKSDKGKMNPQSKASRPSYSSGMLSSTKTSGVRAGRAVYNKPTDEDWALARDMGGAENAVLEETNMFQTDSRDLAADREAEEHADVLQAYGESSVSSADPLFLENEKLERCRTGAATYGHIVLFMAYSQSGHMCSDGRALPEAVSSQPGGGGARRDHPLDTDPNV